MRREVLFGKKRRMGKSKRHNVCNSESCRDPDCLRWQTFNLKRSLEPNATASGSTSASWHPKASASACGSASSRSKRPLAVKLPGKREKLSIYFSIYPPPLSCSKYVKRIHEYTQISPGVFMHAIYQLHRLRNVDSRFELSGYNLHRLLMTAVVLSIKFHEHAWYSNAYYTQVGGIPSVSELNKMELMMLQILEYDLLVQPEKLEEFARQDDETNKYMVYLKKNAQELRKKSDIDNEEST